MIRLDKKLRFHLERMINGSNHFGCFDSVHSRRGNPACIACAFAARIDPADFALKGLVSYKSYRRRSPAFYSRDDGIAPGISGKIVVKDLNSLCQRLCNEFRKYISDVCKLIHTFYMRSDCTQLHGRSVFTEIPK